MALSSLCPPCTECPQVMITDEGITIREDANTVRLRSLMADIGCVPGSPSWFRLARLAKLLSSLTLVWLGIEGAIGVFAGILAGSIALVAFGLDSAIEGLASIIVIWRFTGTRTISADAERWLGLAKQRIAEKLGSRATYGEGTQNVLCAIRGAPRDALIGDVTAGEVFLVALRLGLTVVTILRLRIGGMTQYLSPCRVAGDVARRCSASTARSGVPRPALHPDIVYLDVKVRQDAANAL